MNAEPAAFMTGALSLDGMAKSFNVSRSTIRREIKAGKLKAIKCRRRTLVPITEANEWQKRLAAIQAA